MQPLPDIILFDLDGTLLDNSHVVIDAYLTGLQQLGYPVPGREKIALQAGKNTYVTALALGVAEEDLSKMDAWFWDYFQQYCQTSTDEVITMPGVEPLLSAIAAQSIPLGVVTSNSAENATLLLRRASLLHYFTTIVGKEHTLRHKPAPDPIQYAIERLPSSGPIVWMIGDSAADIAAARAAGIVAVAIPQHHTRIAVQQEAPDLEFTTMHDLQIALFGTA